VRLRLALLVVVALVLAPAAAAKLVPRFDRSMAAVGDRVAVELGHTDSYAPPLEVYLVRTRDEPLVRSRSDRRLVLVGRLRRGPGGNMPSRVSFVVTVPPGQYTVSVWFRGYATGRWANATEGLWRDGGIGPGLVLRVRPR
jgi:hypothetical protein